MYGFSISKTGIITDNYYKSLGYYEDPASQGAYVMIRIFENEIRVEQDFGGSYGLFLYENKEKNYFALSNSFLLLEEYLVEIQNISLNKDFADNFIISGLCTPSIHETLIKEIYKLPSNVVIIINIKKKMLNYFYIDYKENTIPLESEEGLKIIDEWVDKWAYIFRSLEKQTTNFCFDLSGGYDTRTVLSILISSGLNLKNTFIKTSKDYNPDHFEDFKIASNISSKFGFELNKYEFNNESIIWSTNDTLFCSMYSKLGFHKEFYFKNKFYNKPRFVFTGFGGEIIRGYPGYSIKNYLKGISSQAKQIIGHEEEFFNSSMRLCNRSVDLLKERKSYSNDFEISSDLYYRGRTRNHYGKASVEGFIANIYLIQPLIDPDIKRIKFNLNGKYSHDLIAYIYLRFAHDLIYFPIQGNRTLNQESIKKAQKIISLAGPYEIKTDFNENFFVDNKKKCPVPPSNENLDADEYLKRFFNSSQFIENINNVYDNSIYEWAKESSNKSNFFPLRHGYGLLAISITIKNLLRNQKYMNKSLESKKFE